MDCFQERIPQVIRKYRLYQGIDGKVKRREKKWHQIDNVGRTGGSGKDAKEQWDKKKVTDAEQKRHKVPKYTDDVALVPLAADDHVVFQDVDLCSWLNLGLGENIIWFCVWCVK